jgi:hypothetical protein
MTLHLGCNFAYFLGSLFQKFMKKLINLSISLSQAASLGVFDTTYLLLQLYLQPVSLLKSHHKCFSGNVDL